MMSLDVKSNQYLKYVESAIVLSSSKKSLLEISSLFFKSSGVLVIVKYQENKKAFTALFYELGST